MQSTSAAIRAVRTVAKFATGVASYHYRSPFSRLPGCPRILRAARALARARLRDASLVDVTVVTRAAGKDHQIGAVQEH